MALDAVLYNNTVYVSLRCRVCGAWCGTVQCTIILFMFLSAAGFVALGVVLYNRLGQFVSKI